MLQRKQWRLEQWTDYVIDNSTRMHVRVRFRNGFPKVGKYRRSNARFTIAALQTPQFESS